MKNPTKCNKNTHENTIENKGKTNNNQNQITKTKTHTTPMQLSLFHMIATRGGQLRLYRCLYISHSHVFMWYFLHSSDIGHIYHFSVLVPCCVRLFLLTLPYAHGRSWISCISVLSFSPRNTADYQICRSVNYYSLMTSASDSIPCNTQPT